MPLPMSVPGSIAATPVWFACGPFGDVSRFKPEHGVVQAANVRSCVVSHPGSSGGSGCLERLEQCQDMGESPPSCESSEDTAPQNDWLSSSCVSGCPHVRVSKQVVAVGSELGAADDHDRVTD